MLRSSVGAATTLLDAGQMANGFHVLYGLARSRLLAGVSLNPSLQKPVQLMGVSGHEEDLMAVTGVTGFVG